MSSVRFGETPPSFTLLPICIPDQCPPQLWCLLPCFLSFWNSHYTRYSPQILRHQCLYSAARLIHTTFYLQANTLPFNQGYSLKPRRGNKTSYCDLHFINEVTRKSNTQSTSFNNQGFRLVTIFRASVTSFKGWSKNMTTDIWWYKSWEVDRDSSVEPGGKVKSRDKRYVTCMEIKVTIQVHRGRNLSSLGKTLRMTISHNRS